MSLYRCGGGGNAGGVKCGQRVLVNLSGSHDVTDYEMEVCYVSETQICLIGVDRVTSANASTCRSYSWNVTIPAGNISSGAITKTGVKIPTLEDIYMRTANYGRSFPYWLDTAAGGSGAWWVYSDKKVGNGIYQSSTSMGALPFVTIDL